MDVDTRLLRSFTAVAEDGSLSRAAERLFVSQPALTKQIRQLETQLGVRLFTRSRAGMALTEAGEALAGQAPALLAHWERALAATRGAAARAAASTCGRPPGRSRPPGSPTAASTWPCCGCPSPGRATCGSRCCSPSPA